jgi:predicted secreted protein
MKRHVAMPVLVRRVASLGLASLLITAPALAGDRALFDPIGYSEDGRYFAFEEFGIQDGSGFPYSNIYVIDIVEDVWVPGTPHRVRFDTETAALSAARRDALKAATPDLVEFGIDVPAQILALNGDGDPERDGKSLAFGAPGYALSPVIEPRTLNLDTFATTSPLTCADWFAAEPLGFALTLDGTELYRDGALPESRGCPLDYRIHAVALPMDTVELDAAVAIISVYPGGFEGPDRRFVAVPLGH